MVNKCELKIKLLKRVINLVVAFLIIFLLGVNSVYANFRYSDFDYDEFAEQTKNYWSQYCDNGDEKCVDEIIKSQRKYYTKLYKLLAKYEKKGLLIDDAIIIATTFFEFGPSDFNDSSGSYNLDDNDDIERDETASFWENETDTLKLLLKAMIGYERICYGVTDVTVEENTDGESLDEDNEPRYVCNEGNIDGENGNYRCLVPLQNESVTFWQKFKEGLGSFFGIKTQSSMDCAALASEKGYSTSELIDSKEQKVIESGYWRFLEEGNYFDRKPRLYHRYLWVLEKAGKTEISDLYGNEEYEEDLKEVRRDIIKDIKEIIDEYRANRPFANYNAASSNKLWWPIGSAETEEKDGVLFASGNPISVTITSSFGPRIHPITKEAQSTHHGIDIGNLGSAGSSNVIAAKSGVVVAINTNCKSGGDTSCGNSYGNYIQIEHSNGLYTLYAHLHEGTITVSEGDSVMQGQVIAKAGSSESSTATHLHFEVRVGPSSSNAVDPLEYVDPNNPRPIAASLSYVDGGEAMKTVCLSLKSSGFEDNGVAALLTNIQAESGFNPNALGDNGTSYGLCQWHESRWENLKRYSANWQSIEGQLQFLIHELQSGDGGTSIDLYNSLKSGSSSASALSENFCSEFERPANKEYVCSSRASTYADAMFRYVKNNCS